MEWPLTALAVVFLAAYALPILRPDLATGWQSICSAVSWLVWVAFVADYCVRLVLSERRGKFVVTHVVDLVV